MREEGTEDDLTLLRAWRGGDEAAGNRLVSRHFDSIYRFFAGRLSVDSDVVDLAQKTFLACLEKREGWDRVERFKPYLLGVAHKQLLMYVRYHRVRQGEQACGSLQEQLAQSVVGSMGSVMAVHEQKRALLVALRRLPIDLQLTLELHYWEGLTTREVGEVLGVSGGAIKTRLFTARKKLSEQMAQLEGSREIAEVSLRELGRWAHSLHARVPDRPG